MRFIPPSPSESMGRKNGNSASALYLKAHRKGGKAGKAEATAEERYDAIFKSKMKELREEALKGGKYSFNLLGTDASECKQLSKGAQEVIEKIARKKAEQDAKKAKKADVIAITAKSFTGIQGGRIDKKGRIFNAKGEEVFKVDKKTGKIRNNNGSTVGKYVPNSPMSEYRICRLLEREAVKKSSFGGLWGNSGSTSIWGNDTSSFWGNKE